MDAMGQRSKDSQTCRMVIDLDILGTMDPALIFHAVKFMNDITTTASSNMECVYVYEEL